MTPVSLVMTNYNRSRFLGEAIASVLSQTYADFELLIWDDGSTDESVAIARQFEAVDGRVRVIAAAHQGLSVSLRNAIAATQQPYLGWVDSDDKLAPTALAETVAVLEARPEVGLVYTQYQTLNAAGQVQGLGQRCQVPYSPQRLLVEFMTFHFRLLRRSVYEQVGGLDVAFERAEDYDLCLRLSEVTEIAHLPRPLYFYRQHEENVTHDDVEMLRWSLQASRQALQRRGLSDRYEIRVRSELSLQLKAEQWPLVSIIIPCHNAETTLARCLQSCFEQSYPNLEVIVVDNNSTDGTTALLKQFVGSAPRPVHYRNCSQPGQNYARNAGLLEARGEYIQWLDADDELTPDKLTRQVMVLESEPTADLAYGDWQWRFYQQQRLVQRLTFMGQPDEDWLLQLLMDHWRPWHSYLLRRRVAVTLHEHPARDLATRACTDREYFTLAALAGFRARYVAGAGVIYNSGLSAQQITRSTPYAVRVQSLQAMFQRFQQQAQHYEGLEPAHQFLLNQSWALWQPHFELIGQAEQVCWLRHQETQETMMLKDSEARIVQTWLQLPGAYTLEDQARRIVLHLWRETVIRVRRSQGLAAALDSAIVSRELAKVLGLVAEGAAVSLDMRPNLELEPELVALLNGCPLYTPLFGEQRLKVLTVLDSLRRQGWLKRLQAAEVSLSSAPQPVEES